MRYRATPPGARTAYQDFLTLWKDPDHDVPIIQKAKAATPNCNDLAMSPKRFLIDRYRFPLPPSKFS
jgi:hypothetical protein